MPKPVTNKVTVRTVKVPQKNGDIYIYQEERQYFPELKQTRTISKKLLSKKIAGRNTVVSTRKKRTFINITKEETDPLGKVTAIRKHVGMMDIADHLAKESGVDADIRALTDGPTADKILSIARYLLCTDAKGIAGIEEWQYGHTLPYDDGINQKVYHELFKEIGRDETLQQAFFRARLDREGEAGLFLAYDSSTESTWSTQLVKNGIARQGVNGDGLPSFKYLVLFSLKTRMPVWFCKLPGNIPDVISVTPVLEELKALGAKKVTMVDDNGYYSESNIGEMLGQKYDFITLGNIDVKWVKDELDKVIKTLMNPAHACPFDLQTNGVSVKVTRNFQKTRVYGSTKKGLKAGDKETFEGTVYLNFYFNPENKVVEDMRLKESLFETKRLLEETDIPFDSLTKPAKDLFNKCCVINTDKKGKRTVEFLDDKFEEVCKYHGIFVIVTSKKMDVFDVLKWYRKREEIEDFFRRAKQDVDMRHPEVWTPSTLQGRMFVQFVALCMYQYTENTFEAMKDELGEENGDPKHDLKKVLDSEKALKNWMASRSQVRILNWFDAVDRVEISLKQKTRRWSDPITKRDRLFLSKLGVIAAA